MYGSGPGARRDSTVARELAMPLQLDCTRDCSRRCRVVAAPWQDAVCGVTAYGSGPSSGPSSGLGVPRDSV